MDVKDWKGGLTTSVNNEDHFLAPVACKSKERFLKTLEKAKELEAKREEIYTSQEPLPDNLVKVDFIRKCRVYT